MSKIYFTKEITSESLTAIYNKLGVKLPGKIAIKISSGEMGGSNYLKPKLIMPLVDKLKGTIVECNTAYEGSRHNTEEHIKTAKAHGYPDIDIMDSEGEMMLTVKKNDLMKFNIVGDHLDNYDSMLVLSHFKGHSMAGFGGALKNIGIGCASSVGKVYIHTAGERLSGVVGFDTKTNQENFLECIALAAGSIIDFFKKKGNIVFINIMNNISIDCDCDAAPEKPKIQDIGIAASTDPVALDKFCIDMIKMIPQPDKENDTQPFLHRLSKLKGVRILDYASLYKYGNQNYTLELLDND